MYEATFIANCRRMIIKSTDTELTNLDIDNFLKSRFDCFPVVIGIRRWRPVDGSPPAPFNARIKNLKQVGNPKPPSLIAKLTWLDGGGTRWIQATAATNNNQPQPAMLRHHQCCDVPWPFSSSHCTEAGSEKGNEWDGFFSEGLRGTRSVACARTHHWREGGAWAMAMEELQTLIIVHHHSHQLLKSEYYTSLSLYHELCILKKM